MVEHPFESAPSPARDLVVIAASMGGMDALRTIFGALPADFAGAIAVVQHRMATHDGILCELLRSWTPLDVRDAQAGDPIVCGRILIAPADRHMTVTPERTISLVVGAPIHHVLSSADPLFESAAAAFRTHLTAVVLTGGDGDGSTGVLAVKRHGGIVIAQDPETAACSEMPLHAIATGAVDHVLPLEGIAAALIERAGRPLGLGSHQPVASP